MIGGMENYIQSIVAIRDKKEEKDINWKSLTIEKIVAKYSNTETPIFKLVLDGKAISRNNNLVLKYKCITCEVQQEITLNLFMRKVNRDGVRCVSCRNSEETKRANQSQFMKDNFSKVLTGEYEKKEALKVKSASLDNHIKKSQNDWALEDDDFKDAYNLSHLTVEEFENIRTRITDIANGKLKDLTGWVYEPCYRVYNQTRYTPMLINKNTNVVEKPYYVSFTCDNCGEGFQHRDLEIVKNKIRILCKDCSFCNRVFRVRQLKLTCGEIILWQSIFERRFIEWCQEKDITIKNGPKVPYMFQEKQRTYRIDFELPQKKMIIEIKDNHCWHKEQVASGKFAVKEEAAKKWAQENGYTFMIVFPKTLSTFKDELCKI
jgi:DNA-directed RNA polymerase subunit RPC12/RpoP